MFLDVGGSTVRSREESLGNSGASPVATLNVPVTPPPQGARPPIVTSRPLDCEGSSGNKSRKIKTKKPKSALDTDLSGDGGGKSRRRAGKTISESSSEDESRSVGAPIRIPSEHLLLLLVHQVIIVCFLLLFLGLLFYFICFLFFRSQHSGWFPRSNWSRWFWG